MSKDEFGSRAAAVSGPVSRFVEVSPSDAAELPRGLARGLYVGVAGVLRVEDAEGNVASFVSESSQYHPIRALRVHATGTTAASIVALY